MVSLLLANGLATVQKPLLDDTPRPSDQRTKFHWRRHFAGVTEPVNVACRARQQRGHGLDVEQRGLLPIFLG
jgi:hypothetical protein